MWKDVWAGGSMNISADDAAAEPSAGLDPEGARRWKDSLGLRPLMARGADVRPA